MAPYYISKTNLKTTSFLEQDPFTGKPVSGDLEIGYHMLLAGIQSLTNLGIKMSIFLPPIFAIFSVLSVFTLTRRWGKKVAFLSAILAALIPSNLSIGGLVFLVPVNLSLIFIPVALKLAFDAKSPIHYLGIFSISLFVLLSHPPSAVAMIGILSVYALLNLKNKGKSIFLAILLAILVSFPNYIPYIKSKGVESVNFSFWLTLARISELFGYIPTLFLLIGVYFLSKTRKPEIWAILIPIFLFLMHIVLFVFTGFNPFIPYQRVYIPLLLLMSIISAHGLSKIKSKPLVTVIIILIIVFSLKQHFDQEYYHVIDKQEYQDFLWIRDNTPKDAKVLLDPWKARALTPVAERQVLSVMPFGPVKETMEFNDQITDFLKNNCTGTSFLIEHNVSIIYYKDGCENNNLVEINDGIYLVK